MALPKRPQGDQRAHEAVPQGSQGEQPTRSEEPGIVLSLDRLLRALARALVEARTEAP